MLKYIGDFEKLKNFEFIYQKKIGVYRECYIYRKKTRGDLHKRDLVFVLVENRAIMTGTWNTTEFDIIYDLIKAGLVEKVEE